MSAIDPLADLIADTPRQHDLERSRLAQNALIDTISCMFAGSTAPVAQQSYDAVARWGAGDAVVVGRDQSLSPPHAALVNAAAGHALDYDDYDAAANSHPSVILYPALLALASEHRANGHQVLDAYIVGLEILQRLGEAFGPEHYKRGWVSTMTLGVISVAGACCRLGGSGKETAAAALSLGVSMASGLTNQLGFTAKQLHPGLTAKNGMLAASFAEAGITASTAAIDGPIGLARLMCDYDEARFDRALAKLANPWSIQEHGVITKVSPTCGYTQRLVEAASQLHADLNGESHRIQEVRVSVPDYYQDILIYSEPTNAAEAMFSGEYNVAVGLARGTFDLSSLRETAIEDREIVRIRDLIRVEARTPRDRGIYYDALDPDVIEVTLDDGSLHRSECAVPYGDATRPLQQADIRRKFDDCLADHRGPAERDRLWSLLSDFDSLPDLDELLAGLGG